MKKIPPIGYTRQSFGKLIAVMIIIISILIILSLGIGNVPLSAAFPMLFIDVVLAVLFIFSDITVNRKREQKIAHREEMLTCPSVKGKVTETKRIPYFFGKEFAEPTGNVYINGKHSVYRLVVSFHSPVTDREETVVSELYSNAAISHIKDDTVNVYYSPEGEYWVEITNDSY